MSATPKKSESSSVVRDAPSSLAASELQSAELGSGGSLRTARSGRSRRRSPSQSRSPSSSIGRSPGRSHKRRMKRGRSRSASPNPTRNQRKNGNASRSRSRDQSRSPTPSRHQNSARKGSSVPKKRKAAKSEPEKKKEGSKPGNPIVDQEKKKKENSKHVQVEMPQGYVLVDNRGSLVYDWPVGAKVIPPKDYPQKLSEMTPRTDDVAYTDPEYVEPKLPLEAESLMPLRLCNQRFMRPDEALSALQADAKKSPDAYAALGSGLVAAGEEKTRKEQSVQIGVAKDEERVVFFRDQRGVRFPTSLAVLNELVLAGRASIKIESGSFRFIRVGTRGILVPTN